MDAIVYETRLEEAVRGLVNGQEICHHNLESRLGVKPQEPKEKEEERFLKCKDCKYNGDGRKKCPDYEPTRIYISREPMWP